MLRIGRSCLTKTLSIQFSYFPSNFGLQKLSQLSKFPGCLDILFNTLTNSFSRLRRNTAYNDCDTITSFSKSKKFFYSDRYRGEEKFKHLQRCGMVCIIVCLHAVYKIKYNLCCHFCMKLYRIRCSTTHFVVT